MEKLLSVYNADHLDYNFDNRNTLPRPRGKQAFILKDDKLVEDVKRDFGREDDTDLCLKIFTVPFKDGETFETYCWGSNWRNLGIERNIEIGKVSRLYEATVIQNLLWLNDGGKPLAPRVYALVIIEKDGKTYPAQLTEYVAEGGEVDMVAFRDNAEKYLAKFGCEVWHKEQAGVNDYRSGMIIDPQGVRFTDNTKKLVADYLRTIGKYGKAHYQSVPELDINPHPRDTQYRIEAMKLDHIDFTGKKVLDVGCNSGVFLNYAVSRGAKRVLGIDLEDNVKSAYVLAFYLGYFNNDYVVMDVRTDKPNFKADITFYLSMNVHVGFDPAFAHYTKELMVFEENAKGGHFKTDEWVKRLSTYFNSVEVIGYATDHNPAQPKPILWCKK